MAKKQFKFLPTHEKFCMHFQEYGNATQAFLFAWPKVQYTSAKTEGPKLLANPFIKERIEQLQEEFITQYKQDKQKTVRDLIVAAEEFKRMGDNPSYIKARDMVVKMSGFYAPDKVEHSGNIGLDVNIIINKPNEPKAD